MDYKAARLIATIACGGAAFGVCCNPYGGNDEKLWTGIAMLGIAAALIWGGLPNKAGVHPPFLRFDAALVLYPPVILAFLAMGAALADRRQ